MTTSRMTTSHADPTATPAELVRCTDVARTYGSGSAAVVAVTGVSCAVRPGQSTALVGPSGCGKSTLLHLMAGLESPTAGTITWPETGHTPWGRPTEVGVVFQGPSLLPHLDATENVALPLVLDGHPASDALARAREALELLELTRLGAALPDTLSGGQAQRVAIARVLAARPRLVLADEPTGQLDGATGDHVIEVLLRAVAQVGAAVVVSTHDPRIAERFRQQWRMGGGQLVAGRRAADGGDGPPGPARPPGSLDVAMQGGVAMRGGVR